MQPTIDRDPRVRFKHPVRVVPIGGPPRAYRVLASNLSKDGMSLRMPTPFDTGTKVALSLEAGGRVLPFAQGEVVWRDLDEAKAPGRGAGFGVRFTGFLHPRAHELVDYLVANLETGKPLSAPVPASPWRKRLGWIAAGVTAVVLGAGITTWALRAYRAERPASVAAAEPIAIAVEPIAVQPVPPMAPALQAAPAAAEPEEAEAEAMPEAPAIQPPPEVDAAPLEVKAEPPSDAQAARAEATATAEPTAKPEPSAAKSAPAARPEAPAKSEAQQLAIPSGAVRSISTTVEGNQLALSLTLAPGAAITRAFTLRNPDRLAIDVRGAAPRKSHTVSASGVIAKVRIGKLPGGSRIVLDLSRPPGKPVVVSGNSVSVPLR